MNDATRELGAALGIALLGSIAASRYSSTLQASLTNLPAATRNAAESSIANALHVAHGLPRAAGHALSLATRVAFVDGFHLAVLCAAAVAAVAAYVTYRRLPRELPHEGALRSPAAAIEDTVELGIAGLPPAFGDEVRV